METIKCIKERRSIRKFKDDKIEDNIINEIIDAASYAPSWKNSQIARYIVIENREVIDKIADECVLGFEYNTKTLKKSPVLVIVNVEIGKSGFEKDGSYSTPKEDRTVIMGIFDEYKVAEIVDIPENQKIVAFIAMGYPQGDIPAAPKRKPVDELVTYIK